MSLYTGTSELLFFFMLAVLFGFVSGLYYEVFRLIRLALPHGRLIIAIEDLLFTTVTIIGFSFFIYSSASLCYAGTVRWFAVAGAFIGFFLYFISLGRIIIAFSSVIIAFIKKILKIILYPLKKAKNRVILYMYKVSLIFKRKRFSIMRSLFAKRIIKRAGKGF